MAYSILGKALTSDESLVVGKSEIGQGLGPISEIYANGGGAKLTGLLEAFRLIFGLLAQMVEHSTVNRRAIGSSPIQAASPILSPIADEMERREYSNNMAWELR